MSLDDWPRISAMMDRREYSHWEALEIIAWCHANAAAIEVGLRVMYELDGCRALHLRSDKAIKCWDSTPATVTGEGDTLLDALRALDALDKDASDG